MSNATSPTASNVEAPLEETISNTVAEHIKAFFLSTLQNIKQFFLDLFGLISIKRDRKMRYETFLDHCPLWMLFFVILLVIGLTVGAVVMGVFAPLGNRTLSNIIPIEDKIFSGEEPVIHITENVGKQNLNFIYYIRLPFNTSSTGVIKNDLIILSQLEGTDDLAGEWKVVSSWRNLTRQLLCYQNSLYLMEVPNSVFVPTAQCQDIVLYDSRWIPYSYFRVSYYFKNIKEIYNLKLFNAHVDETINRPIFGSFFYMTEDTYAIFEMAWRYGFCGASLLAFVFFFIVTIKNQDIRYWHTFQRWLLILLFLMFWFHNPLYAGYVYSNFWLFPLLQAIFTNTFVFAFLLYILIFFHSLAVRPKDRNIFTFYIIKFFVVGVCWCLSVIANTWAGIKQTLDPSNATEDEPALVYIFWASSIAIGFYILFLIYFICRAIGVSTSGRLPKKYSYRFWVVGGFASIIFVCLIAIVVARIGFNYTREGFTFMLSHGTVTIFFISLSFMFLPSIVPDKTKGMRDKAVTQGETVVSPDSKVESVVSPATVVGASTTTTLSVDKVVADRELDEIEEEEQEELEEPVRKSIPVKEQEKSVKKSSSTTSVNSQKQSSSTPANDDGTVKISFSSNRGSKSKGPGTEDEYNVGYELDQEENRL